MIKKIKITVWSDYVCPFCYLQEPVLERIRREYGEAVEIEWRAFELRPEPVPTLEPDGEYLQNVWNQSVYPMAEQRGMTLRLPPVQPRSRRSFELAEFAKEKGLFKDTHRALFKAFFEDGKDINDVDVLIDIGSSVGLDRKESEEVLRRGNYTERVISDEKRAKELGITAVPAMIVSKSDEPLERAELIMGAQPYDIVKAAVERFIEEE